MLTHAERIVQVDALAHARVLCVGDAMIDHYICGRVERISPEAPVPVLLVESEEQRLGGAGNVLNNLHSLGVETCFIAVTGNDAGGRDLARMIAALGIAEAHLLAERGRTTTIKVRYMADAQQLLRADRERIAPLSPELFNECLKLVRDGLERYRVAIVSDYGKGMLARGLAREIISAARAVGATVIVDPKGTDYGRYRGASILKPNRRELAAAVGGRALETDQHIVEAARSLMAEHEIAVMLVTCGKDGMLLIEGTAGVHRLPAAARDVYDVSGAGDTVAAALGAALASGAPLLEAAHLANTAAGIVVGKAGTAVVSADELSRALADRDALESRKVVSLPLGLERIAGWRAKGLAVGFTNGCFDLLHPGHVSLLQRARTACDRLVVGLNTDESVARLKGPGRPVQSAEARAAVLASLAAVDLVVVFEEDTPLRLIEAIRPDLLVKGADYRRDAVIGGSIVEAYGGKVMLAELLPGYSTAAIIARLSA